MALYGASVPVEVKPGDEPVAVVVICPNHYSHQRLMLALQSIVPEAAEPVSLDLRIERSEVVPHDIAAAILRDQQTDDEPPLRACPNGGCGE